MKSLFGPLEVFNRYAQFQSSNPVLESIVIPIVFSRFTMKMPKYCRIDVFALHKVLITKLFFFFLSLFLSLGNKKR